MDFIHYWQRLNTGTKKGMGLLFMIIGLLLLITKTWILIGIMLLVAGMFMYKFGG